MQRQSVASCNLSIRAFKCDHQLGRLIPLHPSGLLHHQWTYRDHVHDGCILPGAQQKITR